MGAGARFISAKQQEAQIRAYAAAHGHVLGRVFVEPNRSGRSQRRPELQSLLDRITRGESGGVIVVRLDRRPRSLTSAEGLHKLLAASFAQRGGGPGPFVRNLKEAAPDASVGHRAVGTLGR
jgi:hypothetical protein